MVLHRLADWLAALCTLSAVAVDSCGIRSEGLCGIRSEGLCESAARSSVVGTAAVALSKLENER